MASAAHATGSNTMATTDITVLGGDGSAEATTSAGDSAKALAAAVNTDTASTGVKAIAHTH